MDVQYLLKAVATAYKDFKESFQVGLSSEDLFEYFMKSLKASLGGFEIVYDYIWGEDTLNIDGQTKGYFPKNGDTLIMDISVGKDGVWCDVCRTFFVGKYTKEQENVFKMIKDSIKEGIKVLKSGVKACDVYTAVNYVYQKNAKKLVHHAGHKIGEKPLMQPQFLEENKTIIEDGFYTIESGLYEKFGIRLENDFIVDKNGSTDLFEELLPLDIKEYVLE